MPSGPLARKQSLFLGGLEPPPAVVAGVTAGVAVGVGPDGIPPAGLKGFPVVDAAPVVAVHAGTIAVRRDGADAWLGMPPAGGADADDWFPLGYMRQLLAMARAYAAGWREWFALEGLASNTDWFAITAAAARIFVADYGTVGTRGIRRSSSAGVAPWEFLNNSPDVPYGALAYQAAGPGAGLYAAAVGGDIYFSADPLAANPAFAALGAGTRAWMGLAAAPNGDVYATTFNGDIYVRVGGAGAFVSAGATAQLGDQYWRGIAVDQDNGDVWVVTADAGIPSKIYRRILGAGAWTVFASFDAGEDLFGCAVVDSDAYFGSAGGVIWVARAGVFPAVGAESRPAGWRHMANASGVLHAVDAVNSLVLRRT